jgi:hypothetical protein
MNFSFKTKRLTLLNQKPIRLKQGKPNLKPIFNNNRLDRKSRISKSPPSLKSVHYQRHNRPTSQPHKTHILQTQLNKTIPTAKFTQPKSVHSRKKQHQTGAQSD